MTSDDIWLMPPEEYSAFLASVRAETKARFPDAKPKELKMLEIRVVLKERIEGGRHEAAKETDKRAKATDEGEQAGLA